MSLLMALQVNTYAADVNGLPVFGVSLSVKRDAVKISYNDGQLTCVKPENIKLPDRTNFKIEFNEKKSGHLLVLGYDVEDVPASVIDDLFFKNKKHVEFDRERIDGVPSAYYFIFDQDENIVNCGGLELLKNK